MKSLFLVLFFSFSLSSLVHSAEPTALSFTSGERSISMLLPDVSAMSSRFSQSSTEFTQKIDYVMAKFKPLLILDEAGLLKAYNEISASGYVQHYCGAVMGLALVSDANSTKPPVVQLIMMTSHTSPVKLTLLFRASDTMLLDSSTLNYYFDKFSGQVICAEKVVLLSLTDGGINFMVPYGYKFGKAILDMEAIHDDYIQVF